MLDRSVNPETRAGDPFVTTDVRVCEVCGVPATERTLIGLKNDRRRNGPRWCLSHHPASMPRPGIPLEGL